MINKQLFDFFAGLTRLHELNAEQLNDLLLVLDDVSKDMNSTAKDWRDCRVPILRKTTIA